jgi:hypothetical protein
MAPPPGHRGRGHQSSNTLDVIAQGPENVVRALHSSPSRVSTWPHFDRITDGNEDWREQLHREAGTPYMSNGAKESSI